MFDHLLHIFKVGLAAILLFCHSSPLNACGFDEETASDILGANYIRDIIEAVMEHHIDPPTRQQLVLEVLRGVAEAESDQLSSDLSTRISAISDTDALYKLLDEELAQFGNSADSKARANKNALAHLNKVVPGGVKVVPQKEYVVNEQLNANRYVGIGVQTTLDNESQRLQFMEVVPGGTAEAEGILEGDIVEVVDGKDTFQVSINDVIDWIRGPEETCVKLTVRSPGQESRDVEIVRRVVPFKRLRIIEQTQNTTAVLIRLDRLTSSNVHELRKIINDLPITVTTIILDLRFAMDGTSHHLHLLADALLDEGRLGQLISRSGSRVLTTEVGTILDGRKAAVVYKPGNSEQIDWLATVLHERKFPVFRDEFKHWAISTEETAAPQAILEFVPTKDGRHYIGLTTTKLLTKLAGLNDKTNPIPVPAAVPVNLDGTTSVAPWPTGFFPPTPRAPATDDSIVERIVAFLKVQ